MKAKQESNIALALVLVVVVVVALAFYLGGMKELKDVGNDIIGRTQVVDLSEKATIHALLGANTEGYISTNVSVKDARVQSVDVENGTIFFELNEMKYQIKPQGEILIGEKPATLSQVKQGDKLNITWI